MSCLYDLYDSAISFSTPESPWGGGLGKRGAREEGWGARGDRQKLRFLPGFSASRARGLVLPRRRWPEIKGVFLRLTLPFLNEGELMRV